MLRQYRSLKARFPDCLLWFRLGDFYEMFEQDAETAASVLRITLTRRDMGQGQVLPMCGVPYHAADHYLAQLVEAGFRVAICEQLEDPRQARGVVRRDVVRVVSPGTLLEARPGQAAERRYLAALQASSAVAALAVVDVGTGEFRTTRFSPAPPGDAVAAAVEELERLGVRECLVPEGWQQARPQALELLRRRLKALVTPWRDAAWQVQQARRLLLDHFQVATLQPFGLEDQPEQTAACGAALDYLRQTQMTSLAHLTELRPYRTDAGLVVDRATQMNLELVASFRHGSREGSLLGVLDESCTAPGSRLLRRYLEEPLTDLELIHRRLDAVQALVDDSVGRLTLRRLLRGCPDPQRLLARLGCGRAGPRDLAGLRAFLQRARELQQHLEAAGPPAGDEQEQARPGPHGRKALQQAVGSLWVPEELLQRLEAALVDEPPAQLKDGGFIRSGYDPELDRLREAASSGRSWIAALESRERERTGIRSLRVGYNRIFGYYIEVTRPHLSRVPPEYERRQTLAGAERFVTPELKEWESRVLEAEERMQAREEELFEELVSYTLQHAPALTRLADAVARLDVFSTLAELASRWGWVRPEVDDSRELEIVAGRHPVVEACDPQAGFVPNDLHLGPHKRLAVVTGPNMGGKSTFLRQAAIIVLLAQMGSFVPARKARIGLVDRILTRVGASDDLAFGRSTFLVEMEETAFILRHATPRSLVLLDEVGRGTATYDGLSLAWAIVEHLHACGARCLVATHFHELTRLAEELPGAFNLHVAVDRQQGRLVFLRQVRPGAADRSYGIEVARLAGLPEPVVRRAEQVLRQLEQAAAGRARPAPGVPAPAPPARGRPPVAVPGEAVVQQAPLFADADGMNHHGQDRHPGPRPGGSHRGR
ncbi:MAG TPA: DNA mismatch repair protein MutS [Limnochordales bacterium]